MSGSSKGGGGTASSQPRVQLRHRAILAVTALDTPGVLALQRAYILSQVFHARLHVVHPLPNATRPLLEHEDDVSRAVVRWAAAEAKVVLSEQQVRIDIGDPVRAIERAASAACAELVVVGAPEHVDGSPADGGAAPGAAVAARTIATLASTLSRGLFIAHPPRTRCEVVAATDLRDARFPVVKTAATLAEALAARVTVVHNLERDGPVLALAYDNVADRLQMLEQLANELDGIRGGHVSTTRTTAEAIADVARTRDADIVVVGVRRGHGRTLLSLLEPKARTNQVDPKARTNQVEPNARTNLREQTTSSVLAVPLALDAPTAKVDAR